MYSFENREYFWWLIIVAVLAILLYAYIHWKNSVKNKIGSERQINRLTSNFSSEKFKLKYLLLLTAIILGILAAVNLRKENNNGAQNTDGNARGIDIVIVLDVSKSMLAQDIKPSRLSQAKLLVHHLIDNLGGNRIGFVVFAGQAILQMPLTTDAGAAKMLLENLQPNLIPVQGTMIGSALNVANEALGNVDDRKHKAIVLITDGEDHDNRTNAAVQSLNDAGVVVFSVGIGSPDGATIFDPTSKELVKDMDGNTVVSRLGEDQLKNISKATNGKYFRLDNESNAAKKIASSIDTMEKKLLEMPVTAAKTYTSSFPYFIAGMLLLLTIDIFFNERKRKDRIK